MNKIKLTLAGMVLAVSTLVGVATLAPAPALAVTPEQSACEGSGGTWNGGNCTQGTRTVTGTIKSVGNILVFLTGAISVLMIIIGGVRYALSGGDQGTITSAKNTILYAVVGVIVSVAAYAIVNFVLSNV
ncbi:MAG TPA: pilin [Candidatus Saccharimonadales bacterium]|nr:pilin [Candidatus Saccharimonadales bacterium]